MSFLIIVFITCSFVQCFSLNPQKSNDFFIRKVVKECLLSNNHMSCFANKAAKAIEKSINSDVSLFDGVKLLRNQEKLVEVDSARFRSTGFDRLIKAFTNFLNTHSFYVDLTEDDSNDEARGGGGGGDGGGDGDGLGSSFGYSKKNLKKEGKYAQYAFMVLLGIFGLTGPLVMKTLAVMAAKALIASKMALIIVASIALKKIFEKRGEKPSVKVHTLNEGHDRIYMEPNSMPYWSYNRVDP